MPKYLFFLLSIGLPSLLFAQPHAPDTLWSHLYPTGLSEWDAFVLQSPDRGYVMGGYVQGVEQTSGAGLLRKTDSLESAQATLKECGG